MISKIVSTVFSVYTLAMVDFVLAGDCFCDVCHGRDIALNLAFMFGMLVLGFAALMRLATESYHDGKLDGTIDTYSLFHNRRKPEEVQRLGDLQARR